MHIVIVGAGRMGFSLAQQLDEEGHQVVLIDKDPRAVERARGRLDVMAVLASGLRLRSMDEDVVGDADVLVAATGSDEVNIITCLLAREMGIPRHIARLGSTELLRDLGELDRMVLGVDHFVNPDQATVERLRSMVTSAGTTESAEFAGGRLLLRALVVEGESPVTAGPLARLRAEYPHPFVVAAIKRDMELFVPDGASHVLPGDTIYLVLAAPHLDSFLEGFGFRRRRAARVVVFGASRIGLDVCAALEGNVRDVVLVEPDEARCGKAARALARTSVVLGSPLDQEILEEVRVGTADYVMALSSSDEDNLAAALAGKRMGARVSVMLTSQPGHVQLFEPLAELDAVVSPMVLSVGDILRTVREGRVISLFKIAGQRGEALELEVERTSPLDGRLVRDLRLPAGVVLAGVRTREGEIIVPKGDTLIRAEDRVVVVALAGVVEEAASLFRPS